MTWMIKQSIVLALALTLWAGYTGLEPDSAECAQEVTQNNQITTAAIESISVVGDGESTELVITLSSPATYTSYKTTSPLRLVVDLSQTTQGSISAPLEVNKGNFKAVSVSRYDTDAGVLTRVDVELIRDADAVLSTSQEKPGELKLSFPSLKVLPEKLVSSSSATANQKTETEKIQQGPVSVPSLEEQPSMQKSNALQSDPSKPVIRTLSGVTVKDGSIILAVEGGVAEFKSFRLNNPERFVVDLYSVSSVVSSRTISINALGVSTARLGIYSEKVRVVFDGIKGQFPDATAVRSGEGVAVVLNSSPIDKSTVNAAKASTIDQPAKSAEAEPVKPPVGDSAVVNTPQTEKIAAKNNSKIGLNVAQPLVEMLDFQVVDGISRVAIKVVGDVVVDTPVKTPGFVTVTIKNATLPKSLQRSLEAKGFVSPVLRVTPVIVKSRKGVDTKVRIALRKTVPYDFRQEGDMIFVDFKNLDSMTADKVSLGIEDNSQSKIRTPKVQLNRESELGTELTSHAEPSVKALDSSKLYKGRKVTLEFADAEVRKIFQLLSEVSNKNFVLGDDVTGSISIKLVNVPWDQALDIILDTKGLDKREDGNIIIIKGKGKFKSQAEEDLELKKQQYKSIELKSETFNINYADIGGIVSQFNALKSERGAISPDPRTNKVIVKDIPQVIEDMRKLLAQLDIPEKQVMIEARIVEATSTFTRSLGVNWGVHYRDGSASFLGINQLDTGFGGLTTPPPSSGTGLTSGGNIGISFGTLTSNVQLDMRLSAAASAGLIKIVSTPKVATLNNKTAKITQGQQIPYTSSTSDKVETKFIEAALSLEVTPHINANGTIGMKIDAKNDSPGQVAAGSTAPAINKKQATTEMLLRDGETTVIGGIYVDSDNDSDDGVPYLMDIPLLGKLFKTNNKIKTKTELLIFITPRILGAI